jgi:5-methylcytosine-specific restriction endonuclease McrBC regulatory subunit McrC
VFSGQLKQLLAYKETTKSLISSEDHKILFPHNLESIQKLSETFLNQLLEFWENFDNENSLLSSIIFEDILLFTDYIIAFDASDTKRRELIEKNATIKRNPFLILLLFCFTSYFFDCKS